jgi:hypothetical protein
MPCHANLTSTVPQDDGVAAAGAFTWKKDVSSATGKKTL